MNDSALLSELTLDVVTFRASGWRCAVEARLVRASRPLPAGHDDVPALAGYIGLNGADDGPRQLVLFKDAQADIPYAVSAPVQLVAVPVARIHPLPPLLAAATRLRGLRALIHDEEGIVLLLAAPQH